MSQMLLSSSQAVKIPARKASLATSRRHAVACRASTAAPEPSRREAFAQLAGLTAALSLSAQPARAFEDDPAKLCDDDCLAKLNDIPRVKTASGLEYQDIIVGNGPSPPKGYQVTVNYVAMTEQGKIFDSSVERKAPYDIRVGSDQVIPGLDEGLTTMKVGGLRRLYIPGDLAFPNGLPSGPGRPRVPPKAPVMFDVQLLLIPGLDEE